MNAIEELGEVVKEKDDGERALAFARWASRWVEVGVVQCDVDERATPADRYREDTEALQDLLRNLAEERRGEVYELEDLGNVEREPGVRVYRSRMKITILRAAPQLAPDELPPPGGMLQ